MKRHLKDFRGFELNEGGDFYSRKSLMPVGVTNPGATKKAYLVTLDGSPWAIAGNSKEAQALAMELGEEIYGEEASSMSTGANYREGGIDKAYMENIEMLMTSDDRIEITMVGLPFRF